jgi:hypothetical protein
MTSAISSGGPQRPIGIGIWSSAAFMPSTASIVSVMAVRITPGATALIRTPSAIQAAALARTQKAMASLPGRHRLAARRRLLIRRVSARSEVAA